MSCSIQVTGYQDGQLCVDSAMVAGVRQKAKRGMIKKLSLSWPEIRCRLNRKNGGRNHRYAAASAKFYAVRRRY